MLEKDDLVAFQVFVLGPLQSKLKLLNLTSVLDNAIHQDRNAQIPYASAESIPSTPAQSELCPSVSRTYMEGFTIHGLSKVFLGRLWERLFWGLVLLAVLCFLGFKVNGFYSKYKRNEFRTETREVNEFNRTWPNIKVCSWTGLDELNRNGYKKDFCYKNQ